MNTAQRLFTLSLLAVTVAVVATPRRNTSRAGLAAERVSAAAVRDTLGHADSIVSLTGYEKPLRETTESLFVFNNGRRTVDCLCLDIVYSDLDGNMLHSRRLTLPLSLAPGERRKVHFRSWDPHRLFYYHLNTPTRVKTRATPYTVTLKAVYVTVMPDSD